MLEDPGEWFVIYYERCIRREGKNSISTIERVHALDRVAHLQVADLLGVSIRFVDQLKIPVVVGESTGIPRSTLVRL